MSLTRRGPLGLKQPKRSAADMRAGKAHMARVAQLPCVICHQRPVQVHHVIHDRYSFRKASDFETIPLCRICHMDGPNAIHRNKAAWREQNGADWEYLPVVADMLAKEWNP